MPDVERIGHKSPAETEWDKHTPLQLGIIVSNKGNSDNPDFPLPRKFAEIISVAAERNTGIEFQIEFDDELNPIPVTTVNTAVLPFFGVHLPIIGVDMADVSSTPFFKNTF